MGKRIGKLYEVSTGKLETGRTRVQSKRSLQGYQTEESPLCLPDEKPWKGRPWWLRTLKPPPARPLGNETERGQPGLKRSVSRERYVETLVVADKMMVAYHGRRDVEQYVLAIMNIVSAFPFLSLGSWGPAASRCHTLTADLQPGAKTIKQRVGRGRAEVCLVTGRRVTPKVW